MTLHPEKKAFEDPTDFYVLLRDDGKTLFWGKFSSGLDLVTFKSFSENLLWFSNKKKKIVAVKL